MSSRSSNDRYLPDGGFAAGLHIAGGIPPASRNHLVPTGCDTPALNAATSLLIPAAMSVQNSCRSLRVATGGRPGDRNGGRPHRSDRRFFLSIATFSVEVLRRLLESAETALIDPGKPWQNGALESFNGKFRDECLNMEWFRSRGEAKVLIEAWRKHFNEVRPHSSLGYLTPAEFAAKLQQTNAAPASATGRDAARCGASRPGSLQHRP